MRIFDCEQRSPEWYAARCGVPTASEFGRIITDKRGEYAAGASTYINELLDEIHRPDVERGFGGNRHTARGLALEPEARYLYALEHDVDTREVGFILNDEGTLGCSPDSLIDPDDGLELKCPDGPTHVAWLRAGGLPLEHKAQVHGCMIVTGRDHWNFRSYCPPYPNITERVVRDAYTELLLGHLQRFLREYAEAQDQLNQAIKEAA